MPGLTDEQALAGLIDLWRNLTGLSIEDCPIDADDNFIDVYQRDWDHDLDVSLIPSRMRRDLGVDASDDEFFRLMSGQYEWAWGEEWERDVKPTLTFRRVASWIVDHIEMPSFEPMNVAGRRCGPAGAFGGIAATIQEVAPGARFPPRTPILSRVRGGTLERVWDRLNMYASGKLPALSFPNRRVGEAFALAATFVGIAVAIGLVASGAAAWLLAWLPACVVAVCAAFKFSMSGDPLPADLRTFRDLAYTMSAIMNGPEPVRNPHPPRC